jgi:DNA-binding transcriptional regulator LsrR (DeoR family)
MSKEDLTHTELLTEICQLYYREKTAQKEIIKILKRRGIDDVRSESKVAKLLAEAESQGVVFFDIEESFAFRGRSRSNLSRKLREAFRLTQALVIEIPEFTESTHLSVTDREVTDQLDMREDDRLHIILANHAGLFLKTALQADEMCAVAGGRAVVQAVKMIERDPPSLTNIMITSMGGRLWAHQWWLSGSNSMRPLDPDDSAFILFQAFENEPGTMFDQVGHRVFAESRDQAIRVMKDHCMFQPGGAWYRDRCPDRAIVGVGVVDPNSGHRAVRKYTGSDLDQELMERHRSTVQQLEEALAAVSGCELYFGDVANRYFPTLPLPDEFGKLSIEKYEELYDKLLKRLGELNERMVVTEWSHIRSIPSVTAIAGGAFKVRVLWTILFAGWRDRSQRLVNTLVTDAKTAHALISALHAYGGLDPSVKEWYETMVLKFFQDTLP